MEGIAILTTSRVLVDDTGVRQLGALASALAKQTAERAQEQQDTVLEEAQQLDLDRLYHQPPLSSAQPAADPAHPPAAAHQGLTLLRSSQSSGRPRERIDAQRTGAVLAALALPARAAASAGDAARFPAATTSCHGAAPRSGPGVGHGGGR